MKIVEKKSIIKLVTVAIKCDVCSKISNISDIDFYSFSSSHDDNGNDSIDSYESHDVCSVKCYTEKLIYLVNENECYTTFKADDKPISFLKNLINNNHEKTIKPIQEKRA